MRDGDGGHFGGYGEHYVHRHKLTKSRMLRGLVPLLESGNASPPSPAFDAHGQSPDVRLQHMPLITHVGGCIALQRYVIMTS